MRITIWIFQFDTGYTMLFDIVINRIKQYQPQSIGEIYFFLNTIPFETQKQLIAAICLGKEHIDVSLWRQDILFSSGYIDDVPIDNYANIFFANRANIIEYLNKTEECAKNSGFDLNSL